MNTLKKWATRIDAAKAQKAAAVAELKRARRKVLEAEDELFHTEEAAGIVQGVAQLTQQQAHDRIGAVVSQCLETVFDEAYEFQIVFDQKRGRTEARLVFLRDGCEISPLAASGGGVVDVAAFALRLACLALSRPQRRRVVIMDEPFKFVSAEYRARVRDMLDELSDEMGVQFIMVTHIEELQTGHVKRIG